jgi:DNA-binding response OmpR family regulator
MHENVNFRHTIFVVEEDNNVRRSLTRDLRQCGYRLLVSTNVEDALDWMGGSIYTPIWC